MLPAVLRAVLIAVIFTAVFGTMTVLFGYLACQVADPCDGGDGDLDGILAADPAPRVPSTADGS